MLTDIKTHQHGRRQQDQPLDAMRMIGGQCPCDAGAERVSDHRNRTARRRLDHRRDIGREIVISDSVQRTSTASDAPRLRQDRPIACTDESAAEVLEIFNSASSSRNKNNRHATTFDRDLKRGGTGLHRLSLRNRLSRRLMGVAKNRYDDDEDCDCAASWRVHEDVSTRVGTALCERTNGGYLDLEVIARARMHPGSEIRLVPTS